MDANSIAVCPRCWLSEATWLHDHESDRNGQRHVYRHLQTHKTIRFCKVHMRLSGSIWMKCKFPWRKCSAVRSESSLSRICIIYEDGAVIVGTVDGQRCGEFSAVRKWSAHPTKMDDLGGTPVLGNHQSMYESGLMWVWQTNVLEVLHRTPPSEICFRACHIVLGG